MMRLAFYVGSGITYFIGLFFLAIAVLISIRWNHRWASIGRNILIALGIVLIAISSTPIPIWLIIGLTFLVLCRSVLATPTRAKSPRRWLLRQWTYIAICIAAAIAELPQWITPQLHGRGFNSVAIIGDSLSAGVGTQSEQTWPKQFAARRDIRVLDRSRPGATLQSAIGQVKEIGESPAIVVLEIGGNDVLGGIDAAQFKSDLRELLRTVIRPDRLTVMLELPLPPFHSAIARAQRNLCNEYGVVLIPKYILASVLASPDATADGLHLSSLGHERMAIAVGELLTPCIGKPR